MIAADHPVSATVEASQRSARAASFATCRAPSFRRCSAPGDLVVANDAATLPASLSGTHAATGAPVEAAARRLARARRPDALHRGRVRRRRLSHADRGPARRRRALQPGDTLALGPLLATVERILGHPRLVAVRFAGTARCDLGRHRAARPPDPVRPRPRTAGALGRLDQDRRAPGRLRAAVGRLRARLANARRIPRRAASASPRSRTPPASPPPATRRSTTGCPSTSPIAFPEATADGDRAARRPPADESSRSARRSCARSKPRRIGTDAGRAPAKASPPAASARRRGSESSTRSSRACTQPGESHYELLRAFADDASLKRMAAAARRARLPQSRVRRFRADRAHASRGSEPPSSHCVGDRAHAGERYGL